MGLLLATEKAFLGHHNECLASSELRLRLMHQTWVSHIGL